MKKSKFYFALMISGMFLFASCGGEQKGQKPVEESIDAIEVSIDSILVDASALDGKIVKFIATVDHACKHGGNRLTVFGAEEGKVLKIDGTETSPEFSASLDGKRVEITGTVKKVESAHTADCEDHDDHEGHEDHDAQVAAYVVECIDFKELE